MTSSAHYYQRARQLVVQAGSAQFGFVNHPSRLFKFFSQEKHARALVERGELRIGTLHEFRSTDGWDSVRGDAGEGHPPRVARDRGVTHVDEVEDIAVGATESLTLTLEAGNYVVICNIPGHYLAGMHAALTVG